MAEPDGAPASLLLLVLMGWLLGSAGANDVEITPGLKNGILFRPRGSLTLATGAWTAVRRFQHQNIHAQIDTIRTNFQEIDDALERLRQTTNSSKDSEGRRTKEFIEEMIRMWEHEKTWMEAEVRTTETELNDLQAELRLSRRTRGLINAFGEGLKWLFGTATDGDVKKLHQELKGVEAEIGKIHHIEELQTTLIGSLTKKETANRRHILILARKAAELEVTLAATRQADHLTMRNIRRELDLNNIIAAAIRTAGAAVMTLHHEVRRLTQAMTHVQQGHVTPAIIPPATIKALIASITRKLPENWTPSTPASDTPADIYKFLGVAAVPLADGLEVHVQIPLRHRQYSQFDLYQVTPIPTHFQNSSLAVITSLPAEFFAISRDQRLHIELKGEDLQQCQQGGLKTMCQNLTPLIQETREGCLYHAFRDDQDRASTACEKVVQQPKPSIYAIDDHKWMYVLPSEETFSLQCAGAAKPPKGFRLQGTGVFSLPVGCAAMGDRYIVPAHYHRKGSRPDSIPLQDIIQFKISLNLTTFSTELPTLSAMNKTSLQEIIKQTSTVERSPTLAELQQKMKDWGTQEESTTWVEIVVDQTALILGAIATLVTIGLTILACRRRRQEQRSNRARTSSLTTSDPIPVMRTPDKPDPAVTALQARVSRLEMNLREMQRRLDEMRDQEKDINDLKKKCDTLACLL